VCSEKKQARTPHFYAPLSCAAYGSVPSVVVASDLFIIIQLWCFRQRQARLVVCRRGTGEGIIGTGDDGKQWLTNCGEGGDSCPC